MENMMTVCAYCKKKIKLGGRWVKGTPGPAVRKISHGICPECMAKENKKIEKLLEKEMGKNETNLLDKG